MVDTVGIVGLGLIGGSLARRLTERGVRVVAWNHRPHPYAQAEADGIFCKSTLSELMDAEPDVVVLCNPLKAMPAILAALAPLMGDHPNTTLTDVGSVKGMVRDQVKAAGPPTRICTTVPYGPSPWTSPRTTAASSTSPR